MNNAFKFSLSILASYLLLVQPAHFASANSTGFLLSLTKTRSQPVTAFFSGQVLTKTTSTRAAELHALIEKSNAIKDLISHEPSLPSQYPILVKISNLSTDDLLSSLAIPNSLLNDLSTQSLLLVHKFNTDLDYEFELYAHLQIQGENTYLSFTSIFSKPSKSEIAFIHSIEKSLHDQIRSTLISNLKTAQLKTVGEISLKSTQLKNGFSIPGLYQRTLLTNSTQVNLNQFLDNPDFYNVLAETLLDVSLISN